jgi:hypothetical protein
MATNINSFCTSCAKCQMSKDITKRPMGLLHSLTVPERPWQSIGMDFMGPLPKSDTHDYLLVVIDHLTLQVHLIPTNTHVTAKGVAQLFLHEVVRLHGVPDSIVSNRDTKFMSIFWRELQQIMGVKLLMSTAFHPQMDGVTERANHSIGQILHTIIQSDQQDWAQKCPMVEFALNSNVSSTTGFMPFELNSVYMPQIGIPMATDTKFTGVRQFAQQARVNLLAAHDTIIENHILQMFHANKKCWASPGYRRGDQVYLSTKNLALPKGRARKLVPRFIGPYWVTEAHNKALMVTIELPPELVSRHITPTFHASLIQPYVLNNSQRFPRWEAKSFYDFSNDDEQEWLIDEIIAHRWVSNRELEFQVLWMLGDVTWEPYTMCKDLEALDVYLELHGVTKPKELPRKW